MAEGEGGSRRSQVVTLSVIGLVGAVWIGDELIPRGVEMRRNLYPDRAACERDYATAQCEQTGSGSSASHGGGGYRGPAYAAYRGGVAAADPGPGRTGASAASYQTSYRGGFGAFGRAAHAAA